MSEPDPEIRLVPMTRHQRRALAVLAIELPNEVWADACQPLIDAYEAAPADYWDQIAQEFLGHRCKDPDCFTESVLMRLGVISGFSPLSPFGF